MAIASFGYVEADPKLMALVFRRRRRSVSPCCYFSDQYAQNAGYTTSDSYGSDNLILRLLQAFVWTPFGAALRTVATRPNSLRRRLDLLAARGDPLPATFLAATVLAIARPGKSFRTTTTCISPSCLSALSIALWECRAHGRKLTLCVACGNYPERMADCGYKHLERYRAANINRQKPVSGQDRSDFYHMQSTTARGGAHDMTGAQ